MTKKDKLFIWHESTHAGNMGHCYTCKRDNVKLGDIPYTEEGDAESMCWKCYNSSNRVNKKQEVSND